MKHKVVQGDTLPSIAVQYGFTDWEEIYNHSANARLRARRPFPDCLYPGDVVVIPPKQPRTERCEVDMAHWFVLKGKPAVFRLCLEGPDGTPQSLKRYELEVGDQVFKGRTFIDGHLQHHVPPDVHDGKLTVWYNEGSKGTIFDVKIGHLDPDDTVTGLQARLQNMGFYDGDINGNFDEATREALMAFQQMAGVDPNGDPKDSRTLKKLEKRHELSH